MSDDNVVRLEPRPETHQWRLVFRAAMHQVPRRIIATMPQSLATAISQCVPRSVIRVMLSETAPTDAGQPFMEHEFKTGDG